MKRSLSVLCILALALFSCRRQKPLQLIGGFNYSPLGYHYKLVSFAEGSVQPKPGDRLWLDAVFRTQGDSVFWDSRHDMAGKFFRQIVAADSAGFMKHLFALAEGDSMIYYFRVRDFFHHYFHTDSVPFFSRTDSVVKAEVKLRKILGGQAFETLAQTFDSREQQEIRDYFAKNNMPHSGDSSGIFWIERVPSGDTTCVRPGRTAVLSYKGYFLDGRPIDFSNGNFTYVYGTPDQMISGLNSVIGRMKKGDFVKIILSSWLAFGRSGSSNGTIPPFTPLLYEVKLIEVK